MYIKKVYTIEEIFFAIDEAKVFWELNGTGIPFYFDGDTGLKFNSLRMANFRQHGIQCASCGIKGSIFRKERINKNCKWHLALYAKKDGQLIEMTIDHIMPRSRGGSNTLKNVQTMCGPCNVSKGSILPKNFYGPINLPKVHRSKKMTWNIFWRRFKYMIYKSMRRKKLTFPSRYGTSKSTISSLWKY